MQDYGLNCGARINCNVQCTFLFSFSFHNLHSCFSFLYRSNVIDPDATTVAIDDVGNLDDFDEFPAFPHLGDDANDFLDLSNDSSFICNSQAMICPCCLQELDDF